jgi:MFS family permease
MMPPAAAVHDSRYSWLRLALAVAAGTIGSSGMWTVVVVLPAVQAEFGGSRADASLAYTLTMLGFAGGGVLMGRLADRFGVRVPVMGGGAIMALGYVVAAQTGSLWQFALVQGVLIAALGSAGTFGPLIADISRWFVRRRGIAVALCASGNYFAGALWPPVVQALVDGYGWRTAYTVVGILVAATLLPLAMLLRRPPPADPLPSAGGGGSACTGLGLPPRALEALLAAAAVACCVAMSMPQVHIVAYCVDLGYGAARGADMLALMLGAGVISRVASGFVADKIGGLATLLIGSLMQGIALAFYLLFDGLYALYAVSLMFGLFQGGIVPSYAIIVREYFPAAEAGTRVGVVLMASLAGMALGGWLSGAIFDWTGSYTAAFVNGLAWNVANLAIVGWLLRRARRHI